MNIQDKSCLQLEQPFNQIQVDNNLHPTDRTPIASPVKSGNRTARSGTPQSITAPRGARKPRRRANPANGGLSKTIMQHPHRRKDLVIKCSESPHQRRILVPINQENHYTNSITLILKSWITPLLVPIGGIIGANRGKESIGTNNRSSHLQSWNSQLPSHEEMQLDRVLLDPIRTRVIGTNTPPALLVPIETQTTQAMYRGRDLDGKKGGFSGYLIVQG